MSPRGEQFWELLEHVRELQILAEREVRLLEAILEMQKRIQQEIARGLL